MTGSRARSHPSKANDLPPFAARVVAWQREHGRHALPWQQTRDAYRIWLSEIMLQQTQVATVLPYFQRFVEAFPDVRALAQAPIERVLEHWSGLGYYRRAHHLHRAARIVVECHGGEFPRELEAIAALPGVGRSTAAAIAAFAFGTQAAILDGNVKRVLARHRGIEGFPGTPELTRKLWSIAEALTPAEDVERYTQGMMDLGATVCTRTPACLLCPVAADCVARIEGRIDDIPAPRPARAVPHREAQLLVVERAGALLFERRPSTGIWAGLWSFPQLAMDERIDDVVRTRFRTHASAIALPSITHAFTHFTLTLHPRHVAIDELPRVASPDESWMRPDDAMAAALPAPIRRLVSSLQSRGEARGG